MRTLFWVNKSILSEGIVVKQIYFEWVSPPDPPSISSNARPYCIIYALYNAIWSIHDYIRFTHAHIWVMYDNIWTIYDYAWIMYAGNPGGEVP